jgi:hypothetical protein
MIEIFSQGVVEKKCSIMILDFCLIWDARSMFLDDVHDVA